MSDLHRREARRLMLQARAELRADGGFAEAGAVSTLLAVLDGGGELEPILDSFEDVIESYKPVVVPLVPRVQVLLP